MLDSYVANAKFNYVTRGHVVNVQDECDGDDEVLQAEVMKRSCTSCIVTNEITVGGCWKRCTNMIVFL